MGNGGRMFEFMTPFPGEGGGRIVMFPSGPFLGPPAGFVSMARLVECYERVKKGERETMEVEKVSRSVSGEREWKGKGRDD